MSKCKPSEIHAIVIILDILEDFMAEETSGLYCIWILQTRSPVRPRRSRNEPCCRVLRQSGPMQQRLRDFTVQTLGPHFLFQEQCGVGRGSNTTFIINLAHGKDFPHFCINSGSAHYLVFLSLVC